MANVQHIDMFAGETRTLALAGRDSANLPYNLSGKTVTWYLGRSPFAPDDTTPIVTKPGSIVSAPGGTFTVALASSDTQDLNGDFGHMALATDGSGAQAVLTSGRFRIRPVVMPT